MKAIDDTSTKEQNEKIQVAFDNERLDWKKKILDLIEMTKDTRKLAEAQVFQLSYRQIITERIAEYEILIAKKESALDKLYTKRFREYTLEYDIKLTGTERQVHINADLAAIKIQLKIIASHKKYLEESVKTLDNLGFSIKNKIEMATNAMI